LLSRESRYAGFVEKYKCTAGPAVRGNIDLRNGAVKRSIAGSQFVFPRGVKPPKTNGKLFGTALSCGEGREGRNAVPNNGKLFGTALSCGEGREGRNAVPNKVI